MFTYKQGDVVFVPFLFTDASTSRKRPVLIISNDSINGNNLHHDFVAVAITSTIRGTSYAIKIDQSDMQPGHNLRNISEIQCDKLATIQKNLVINKIGRLNDTVFTIALSKIKNDVIGN